MLWVRYKSDKSLHASSGLFMLLPYSILVHFYVLITCIRLLTVPYGDLVV